MNNFKKISILLLLAISIVACNNSSKPTTDESPKSDSVEVDGVKMSQTDLFAFQTGIDSLMSDPDRVILNEKMAKLFAIPDSILSNPTITSDPDFNMQDYWTPEQKRLGRLIAEVQLAHVKLVEGKFVVDISRQDFVKKGLPADYYDFFVQSYTDMNVYNRLAKKSPQTIAIDWAEMQDYYQKQVAREK